MTEFFVPKGITITANDAAAATVRDTLAALPLPFVTCVAQCGIDIRVLDRGESFADVAKRYAPNDSCGDGIVQGLYAPAHQQVIIKQNDPGIIAHELFHVSDYFLGSGLKMRSQLDDRVRERYLYHKHGDGLFISRYGSVNQVEFVAEFGRAALGFSEQPPGRPHDLDRLKRIDPQIVTLVQSWLDEIAEKVR